MFTRGTGPDREQRAVRYSPLGAKSGLSLARLSDREHGRPAGRLAARLDLTGGLPPLTATGRAPPAGPSIDLHVHSSASDGSLAPEAVVSRARPAGLTAMCSPIRDTVAGVPAAVANERSCRRSGSRRL